MPKTPPVTITELLVVANMCKTSNCLTEHKILPDARLTYCRVEPKIEALISDIHLFAPEQR